MILEIALQRAIDLNGDTKAIRHGIYLAHEYMESECPECTCTLAEKHENTMCRADWIQEGIYLHDQVAEELDNMWGED